MSIINSDYGCPSCGEVYKGLEEGLFVLEYGGAIILHCKTCNHLFSRFYDEKKEADTICPKCGREAVIWDHRCPKCQTRMTEKMNYSSFV